jgi:tetratricopeptide (TPR) repeat protein
MRTRRPALTAVLLAVFPAAAALLSTPARADTVYLKNGGTIACDSIEERGSDLVLHQPGGVIVVPRADVARIEKSAPAPAAGAAAPASGAPRAPAATTAGTPAAQRSSPPGAAPKDAALREQVNALLSEGSRALGERRFDDARRRFEEALMRDPASTNARGGLAAALLGLGQPARARTILDQALLDAPNDPGLHRLLGETLVRLDRATEAIAALEKSYALRPDPGVRARIDELRRHDSVDGEYRRAEGARFTVVYDRVATSPAVEEEILPFLDEQYPTLSRLFDYVPVESITVVVYPGEEDFRHATQADAMVAGLYDGKVRVPSGSLRRLDTTAKAVLTHELAHAFIAGKSAGGAPRWLHEGLAQYAEGKRTPAATETALAREYRDSGGSGWGTTFTYASALSFVEYLLAQYGQTDVNQVLTEMGGGADPGSALKTVTRESLADLLTAWGDDLVRRRLS